MMKEIKFHKYLTVTISILSLFALTLPMGTYEGKPQHEYLPSPLLAVADKQGDPGIAGDYLWGVSPYSGEMVEILKIDGDREITALAFAEDGTLYGLAHGSTAALYTIDLCTGHATNVGPFGFSGLVIEGGLVITPDQKAYGAWHPGMIGDNETCELFEINLSSGEGTIVGEILAWGLGHHGDIDGLAYRDDGKLLALLNIFDENDYDNTSGKIICIDPSEFNSDNPPLLNITIIADLESEDINIGGVGDITIYNGMGYLATCIGPHAYYYYGSNELWRFNPYSGDLHRIDEELVEIWSRGVSALTTIPSWMLPDGDASHIDNGNVDSPSWRYYK